MDLMIRSIISHFFPNSCLACEKEIDPGHYLCFECLNSMAGPIMAPLELPYIDSAFSYWKYESPMRE
ncbi:MAG: ComF family protein, partial [Mesotoga sp.]|nr:ComF family protein [Mesotoga sp.]